MCFPLTTCRIWKNAGGVELDAGELELELELGLELPLVYPGCR